MPGRNWGDRGNSPHPSDACGVGNWQPPACRQPPNGRTFLFTRLITPLLYVSYTVTCTSKKPLACRVTWSPHPVISTDAGFCPSSNCAFCVFTIIWICMISKYKSRRSKCAAYSSYQWRLCASPPFIRGFTSKDRKATRAASTHLLGTAYPLSDQLDLQRLIIWVGNSFIVSVIA